jgi:predicted nucleotidyltransferase
VSIDRDYVLARLREQREHIEREYGMRMVGIVGSVARGDATEESDIDVFVDVIPARAPSLFKLFDAEEELKKAIGIGLPVEFVFREALRPTLRSRMERELVSI